MVGEGYNLKREDDITNLIRDKLNAMRIHGERHQLERQIVQSIKGLRVKGVEEVNLNGFEPEIKYEIMTILNKILEVFPEIEVRWIGSYQAMSQARMTVDAIMEYRRFRGKGISHEEAKQRTRESLEEYGYKYAVPEAAAEVLMLHRYEYSLEAREKMQDYTRIIVLLFNEDICKSKDSIESHFKGRMAEGQFKIVMQLADIILHEFGHALHMALLYSDSLDENKMQQLKEEFNKNNQLIGEMLGYYAAGSFGEFVATIVHLKFTNYGLLEVNPIVDKIADEVYNWLLVGYREYLRSRIKKSLLFKLMESLFHRI